jgi:hypothetical protein
MSCLDFFDFLKVSFVFNSFTRGEPGFLCSLECFKSTGEYIFCENKIKVLTGSLYFRVIKELSQSLYSIVIDYNLRKKHGGNILYTSM